MCTCEYCGKKFDSPQKLKGHYGQCETKRKILTSTLTKDVLHKLMFEQMMSSNYIGRVWMKEQTGHFYGASAIISLAKSYGFKTRSVKESNINPERQKLYKKTLSERYGDNITNISQLKSVKDKKENTFIKHFGVRNIFCNSKYIMDCFEDKYGVPNNAYRQDVVLKYSNGIRSKIHKEIENMLDEYGVEYQSELVNLCAGFNEQLNKEYRPRPDIFIPSLNIILEIQGDKWHANPNIYKSNDLITGLWVGELTASEIWERDRIRKKHMESFGYKVYYIWEYDIRHNLPQVKNFIKDLIKK